MRGAACACAWLVVIAISACTPIERPSPASQVAAHEPACSTSAPAVPEGSVVTTLQTRDHEVTVYAVRAGLRFTVAAADGVVLAQQLSEREFAASFPGLHARYDSAFAGERPWIDASAVARTAPDRGL